MMIQTQMMTMEARKEEMHEQDLVIEGEGGLVSTAFLDRSPSFLPATDVMIGRENQTEKLDKILKNKGNHGSGGIPLVVVHGVAGSGKSSFVQTYPWEENGWILTPGKFEEKRTQEPYSAIIDALTTLIHIWRAAAKYDQEPEPASSSKLEQFQDLLVSDFELLKDVLPRQVFETAGCDFLKPPPDEKTEEAKPFSNHGNADQTRTVCFTPDAVNAALRRVISFLYRTSSRPVALFLEDVHWVDRASMNIIEDLVSCNHEQHKEEKGNDGGRMVLIVSCRDHVLVQKQGDEEDHPVYCSLQKIQAQVDAAASMVHMIEIVNLDSTNLNKLLMTMLGTSDPEETNCLTDVIYAKTSGNPFFVMQFLQLIQQETLLDFSYTEQKNAWCDDHKLRSIAKASDNVADVVAATLHKLPNETQMALKVASCLGKNIPVDILCEYFAEFPDNSKWDYSTYECIDTIQVLGLPKVLDYAAQNGVLIRPDDSSTYMWAHEKLQDVAYSFIPKSELPALHMNLGKRLWSNSFCNTSRSQTMTFMAAEQLSRVSDTKNNETLGVVATHIYLKAAKLSMSKSALFAAMETLRAGAKILNLRTDRWSKRHYELSLDVYSCLAEVGVQIGLRKDAMEAVREINENARCLDHKFRSQLVMLKCATSGSDRDYSLGVTKTLEVLKLYGEKLPTRLLPGQLLLETQMLKSRLPGRRLGGLMDLPEMLDSRSQKIITLLARELGQYAFLGKTQRQVASLACIRALNIACKMGVTTDTTAAVLWMAIDLKREGYYPEACEYAGLAMQMIKNIPKQRGSLHALVLVGTNNEVFPAARPFHTCLQSLLECNRVGIQIGETEPAMGSLLGYTFSYLSIGFPLGPLESDLATYMQKAAQLGLPYPMQLLFKVLRQGTLNLINQPQQQYKETPTYLRGQVMDQDEELTRVSGGAATMTTRDINTIRLMLACVYNEWDTAETILDQLESYIGFQGLVSRDHFRMLYMGLAACVVGRRAGKRKYLSMARKIIKSFKAECKLGYVNAKPILVMLKAESTPSLERYNQAIEICGTLGLIHHQAYMCEGAGAYCIGENDLASGRMYLLQAYSLYNGWGATGKLVSMKHQYCEMPEFLSTLNSEETSDLKKGLTSRYSTAERILLAGMAWDNLLEGGITDNYSIGPSSMGTASDSASVSDDSGVKS